MLWIVLLICGALCLLSLEMVLPSWGTLTLGAVCCVAYALKLAYGISDTAGTWTLVGVICILPLAFMIGSQLARYSPIMLRDEPVVGALHADAPDHVGREGVVVAPLRPIGTVLLDGESDPIDAASDHGRLAKGTQVLVVGRRGAEWIVKTRELGSSGGVEGA